MNYQKEIRADVISALFFCLGNGKMERLKEMEGLGTCFESSGEKDIQLGESVCFHLTRNVVE